MSIIEVATEARRSCRIVPARDLTLAPEVCIRMAEQYHLLCVKRPFVNRCMAAFTICAQNFPEIDLKNHPGTVQLVVLRQQLMAFCRAVSTAEPRNTWKGIGRAINCRHGTVINAHRIYGRAMERALHG